MNDLKHDLHRLYADASKHSAYQSVPDFVSAALGYTETIDEGWRGDRPRLRYLLDRHAPQPGEHWGDFGANTGFFTLSLAHRFPESRFTAIEANPNHAAFIRNIAERFGMGNVAVTDRAIGLDELEDLPVFDFLLHQNVLHHAGHDFDQHHVPAVGSFPGYAERYLRTLRTHASRMLFQLGSNWGGNKATPWVGTREDARKLCLIMSWLADSGWHVSDLAFPTLNGSRQVTYLSALAGHDSERAALLTSGTGASKLLSAFDLDVFPGEFYRRPLFICEAG